VPFNWHVLLIEHSPTRVNILGKEAE